MVMNVLLQRAKQCHTTVALCATEVRTVLVDPFQSPLLRETRDELESRFEWMYVELNAPSRTVISYWE